MRATRRRLHCANWSGPLDIGARKAHLAVIDLQAEFSPGVLRPRRSSVSNSIRTAAGHKVPAGAHCDRLKGIVMSQKGTVKWFNATKGYGFIQPDEGGNDIFVHISAVERAGMRSIVEGQQINFDVTRDAKSGKLSADNLQAA
jgi:cold shock protein